MFSTVLRLLDPLRILVRRRAPRRKALAAVLCAGAGVAWAQGATCGPSRAGAVCEGAGVASLGQASGSVQAAGNPIHLITGNKYLAEVDLAPLPGPLGLEVVRHYNSVHAGNAGPAQPIGRGWRLSYDTELAVAGRSVQVLQADGSRLVFRRSEDDPSACASDDPSQGRLVARQTSDGERFDWHWPDGRVLGFDGGGKLVHIALPTGDLLTLRRDAQGRLERVSDSHGRELRFGYRPPDPATGFVALAFIDSPVGRFEYRHDAAPSAAAAGLPISPADPARLIAVVHPGVGDRTGPLSLRRYHHEDARFPGRITGVSVSGPDGHGGEVEHRLSTYTYDTQGRGRSTERAGHRLTFDYPSPGRTTVTDPMGRTTEWRHALVGGQWRILEWRDGRHTMRWAHDALGRTVRETAYGPDGRALRSRITVRDAQGRIEAVAVVEHRPGRPAEPVWVERHAHQGDMPWPVESRYPSVVVGRDRVVTVERDAAGQVLRVREHGFTPVDAQGEVLPTGLDGRVDAAQAHRATPLERETRLAYARIRGLSRLMMIDGPLRGPSDGSTSANGEDVVHLEWDPQGLQVRRLVQPDGSARAVQHDAAGRLTSVASDVWRTQWALDAAGRWLEARQSAADRRGDALAVRWTYDALGQAASQSAGRVTSAGFQADLDARTWRAAHDPAGRWLWTADARGQLEPAMAASAAAQADRAPSAGAPRIREVFDDFGRRVAWRSADHGDRVFGHDAADRLVWMRDAAGQVARYAYDPQGRLVHQQWPGPHGSVQKEFEHGSALSRVRHPVQHEVDRRDAEGRLVERHLSIDRDAVGSAIGRAAPNGLEAVSVLLRWRHDASGRPVAASLPDGSWLRLQRNGVGQVVGVVRDRLSTPWLRPLLPPQVLASGIERDRVDLSRLTTGNGYEMAWWRSSDGRLARLVHRRIDGLVPDGVEAANAGLRAERPRRLSWGQAIGVGHVHASPAAPGWIGRPPEPQALIDDRFGWDPRGNLVVRESRALGRHDTWQHRYDAGDRLLLTQRASASLDGSSEDGTTHRYAYDAQGRRVLAHGARPGEAVPVLAPLQRLELAPDSHRLIGVSGVPVRHDRLGRPARLENRQLAWSATGQLLLVTSTSGHPDQEPLSAASERATRYGYNHRGERVLVQREGGAVLVHLHDDRRRLAELDEAGRVARQWIWLADLPLAVIDSPPDRRHPPVASDSPIAAVWRDLRTVFHERFGAADRITWLHTNHLGAPVAATDERGRIRWQAHYQDFGRAEVRSLDGFQLDLRLPGQHEDPETGWHHNDHRTYHPDLGRFLTPDPLGTPDGPDPYAYVRNNPLRWIDPTGLVLWAFDGTSNSPASRTNVWHFAQAYDGFSAYDRAHGITGMSFYIEGPGVEARPDGIERSSTLDAAIAHSLNDRIARQFRSFERYTRSNWDWHRNRSAGGGLLPLRIELDVVGFSRGAAMSREFIHRVNDHLRSDAFRSAYGDCLTVVQRMLALFDTVLSVNTAEHGLRPLRLAIPAEVQSVFHAVALNEHRGLFGVESIHPHEQAIASASPNRIERGFVGAHADIGGGYAGITADATGGDLSDIALVWMVAMARSAGVEMRQLPEAQRQVTSPIVHDELRAWLWGTAQRVSRATDRNVSFRSPPSLGTPSVAPPASPEEVAVLPHRSAPDRPRTVPQGTVTWASGMNSARAREFLTARTPAGPRDVRIADVDLCRYIDWLNRHYREALAPTGHWQRPPSCPPSG